MAAVATAGANEVESRNVTKLQLWNIDGIKGNQVIKTDPATVDDVGYAHPVQLDVGAPGGDFVAIGTFNGMGTSGHAQDCADSYDSKWSVYTDGTIGGAYFCVTESVNAYAAGATPSFRIPTDGAQAHQPIGG
jgi:hypothetical protein